MKGVGVLGVGSRVCCVVPAPAPATTVVAAVVAAVAAVATPAAATPAAAARGPAARAQLDSHALAAAVAPVQVAHRVALQGRGERGG